MYEYNYQSYTRHSSIIAAGSRYSCVTVWASVLLAVFLGKHNIVNMSLDISIELVQELMYEGYRRDSVRR